MPTISKEEGLKRFRFGVARLLAVTEDIPPLCFIPTKDGSAAIEMVILPQDAPQVDKCEKMFRLGFMAARSDTVPLDLEYMLFGSLGWVTKKQPGAPLVGQIRDQPDAEEILQVLVSTREGGVVEGWMYAVARSKGEVSLDNQRALGTNMRSPLTMSFWAGFSVGAMAAELIRLARGEG